jgi:hypothetical protein
MFEHNPTIDLISAALIFIEKHRSLEGFGLNAEESDRVLQALLKQDLIVRNEKRQRYELSRAGHKWLIISRRQDRKQRLPMSWIHPPKNPC